MRCVLYLRILMTLVLFSGILAATQAVSLQDDEYLVWGIDGDDVAVPEGSVITEAVLTIENPSTSDIFVHLLDNPDLEAVKSQDIGQGNVFEGYGVGLQGQMENGNLVFRLSQINDPQSDVWNVFETPFNFTLANNSTVQYSSSLLQLIDFAGTGRSFGFGLDSALSNIYFDSMELILQIEAYQDTYSYTEVTFSLDFLKSPPVAFWAFDDSMGSTVSDSGGFNDGTLVLMDSVNAWADGVTGGALAFDGFNDFVEIPDSKGITGTQSRSMACWIKTTKASGTILSWGTATNSSERWILRTQDDFDGDGQAGLRLEVNGGRIIGSTNIIDGQWHHVAAVFDNDGSSDLLDVTLYVDGQAETLSSVGNYTINTGNTQNIQIGISTEAGAGLYYQGLIDDMGIWNMALSAGEVLALYADADALNHLPIANAGSAQSVIDIDNNGNEEVTLDGSGSSDVDGTIISWVWSDSLGDTIPDGQNPTVALSTGIHTITLTVTDNEGSVDIDTVTISVSLPDIDLINFWTFDDLTGSTVSDLMGSNDGTLVLMDSVNAWADGVTGGALAFDGFNDFVEIPDSKGITGTQSRSMACWIKTTKASGTILSWGTAANSSERWILRIQDDFDGDGQAGLRLEVNGGRIIGSTNIIDGQWHHVAAVFDNDGSSDLLDVTLYVDGQAETLSSVGNYTINTGNTQNIQIGISTEAGAGLYYQGLIDDMGIWNRALSASEVAVLYANDDILNQDLVNLWAFDDSMGSTVSDSGGFNDGTLVLMDSVNAWADGVTGGALAFDGFNDFVEIPDSKGITGTQSRSMACWIKTTKASGTILSWGTAANSSERWILRTQDDFDGDGQAGLRLEVNGGRIIGSTNIIDGQWHHVAAVFDNDGSSDLLDVTLYVDGQAETLSSVGNYTINTGNTQNIQIGISTEAGAGLYYQGLIDDMGIWNRALSAGEITVMYNVVQ